MAAAVVVEAVDDVMKHLKKAQSAMNQVAETWKEMNWVSNREEEKERSIEKAVQCSNKHSQADQRAKYF